MNGIETLVKTLLKSIGFNPEEFISGMQAFLADVQRKLLSIEAQFAGQQESLTSLHGKIDRLQSSIDEIGGIVPPAVSVDNGLNLQPLDFAQQKLDFTQQKTVVAELRT